MNAMKTMAADLPGDGSFAGNGQMPSPPDQMRSFATAGADAKVARDFLKAELERQIKGGSRKLRAGVFDRVVDMCFADAADQDADHMEFFGDMLIMLMDDAGPESRAELSRRLALLPQAPAKLVRRIANDDDIAVAGPILSGSEQLNADDLFMLARTKAQKHLFAISGRKRLDAAVTGLLLEHGDAGVVEQLAKNLCAEFSEDGYARLAQRAMTDFRLAEVVVARADVPKSILRIMVAQADETMRARLLAAAGPEKRYEIEDSASPHAGARDYTPARERIKALQREGRLRERDIAEFAATRRLPETLAALELLSSTPADVVERLLSEAPAEAIPAVCKAAGLSWETTRAVLGLCRQLGRPQSEQALRRALANYGRLTAATSEKLLRFWFVRGTSAGRASDPATPPSPASKHRAQERRDVDLPAVILVNGKFVAHCMIEDLSMGGARLRVTSTADLPDQFLLCLPTHDNIHRNCIVCWRSRDTVGVRFPK